MTNRLSRLPTNTVFEGLEHNDLARLVHNEVHIDEYKSKMGEDEDIVVISFKVTDKGPATDLVNFVEKSYEWVLDADASSGEMSDGGYVVFLEIDRRPEVAADLLELLTDLVELTDIKLDEWRIRYHKDGVEHHADLAVLRQIIPSTPEEYLRKTGQAQQELDKLKTAAGVKVTTRAPKNDYTESLRVAAGLR